MAIGNGQVVGFVACCRTWLSEPSNGLSPPLLALLGVWAWDGALALYAIVTFVVGSSSTIAVLCSFSSALSYVGLLNPSSLRAVSDFDQTSIQRLALHG